MEDSDGINKSLDELYKARVPTHAFATDAIIGGLRMYPKEIALRKALVQHNFKHSLGWLVYDLDIETAATEWYDRNAPTPNIFVINQNNGHGHLFYGLKTPVHNYEGASEKALRYLAAIDVALTEKLGADPGYSKLISKNPLNDRWITQYLRYDLYDLDELSEWVDLERYQDKRKRLPTVGYGRNCTLFERLRRWAYKERRQPYLSREMFHAAVRQHALVINQDFDPPLPHSEVRATAKSVALWTWKRMNAEGFRAYQTALSRKAADKRTRKAAELRQAIIEAVEQCPELTQEDIAAMFGINQGTVSRHLRNYAAPISDNRAVRPDSEGF